MNNKLLFVGNTSWSMWNFRGTLMLNLKKLGYEISVAAPEDKFVNELKINFNFIPLKTLNRKSLNPWHDLRLVFEFYQIYRKVQPQIVFQYTIKPNIFGSVASFLSKTKSLSFVTGMGFVFIRKNMLTSIVSYLYRVGLYFSYKVVFLNQQDFQDFIRLKILEKDSSKGVLLPGEGVDVNYFYPQDTDFNEDKVFLFIGRLLKDKGIMEFVNAAKLLKLKKENVSFRILGALDFQNPAAICKSDLDVWQSEGVVEYLGETSDVRSEVSRASVVVLPSYLEGMSRVLMEASAMGKPIIATNVRGCREFVSECVNGFLVEPKSTNSLLEAFEKFCELSDEKIKFFGKESRKLAEHNFSSEKTVSKYLEIIKEII